jgi:hypothetical protein
VDNVLLEEGKAFQKIAKAATRMSFSFYLNGEKQNVKQRYRGY